jgi:HPt (histidine-containing phosphotransfer) domain-containing protein
MDDFLSKPLRREAVADTLDRWTTRQPAPSPTPPPPPAVPAQPETPAPSQRATLDLEQLRSLVGDDPATLREYLELFLASTGPALGRIDAAITSRAEDDLRRQLHALRGSALSLGANAVGDCARRLEERVQNHDWDDISELHADLEQAFAVTTTLIREVGS